MGALTESVATRLQRALSHCLISASPSLLSPGSISPAEAQQGSALKLLLMQCWRKSLRLTSQITSPAQHLGFQSPLTTSETTLLNEGLQFLFFFLTDTTVTSPFTTCFPVPTVLSALNTTIHSDQKF